MSAQLRIVRCAMQYWQIALAMSFVVVESQELLEFPDTASKRLVVAIRNATNTDVRPVIDISKPTTITLKPTLYQILDVDEVNQAIELSIWMDQRWTDELVVWSPKKYGGVRELRLSPDVIWRPDTYIYNNLVMDDKKQNRFINVLMRTNVTIGVTDIILSNPIIVKASCSFTMQHFPFDTQSCTLEYGSWTHDSSEITYSSFEPNVSLDYYSEHSAWQVLSFYSERKEVNHSCCPHSFITVVFHLNIQRNPLFYIVNLVIPAICVAVMNFVAFFTPTSTSGERGEKVSLSLTTLLAMGVLLLQLSDHTPKTSVRIPLIGLYIVEIIILIGLGAIMTIVVIFLQRCGELGRKPPNWLKRWCENRLDDKSIIKSTSIGEQISIIEMGRMEIPAIEFSASKEFSECYAAIQGLDDAIKDQNDMYTNKLIWSICADKLELLCLVLFLGLTLAATIHFFAAGYSKLARAAVA